MLSNQALSEVNDLQADTQALAAAPEAADLLPVPDLILEKRACVAAFMDLHPEVFQPPAQSGTWSELVQRQLPPSESERAVIDQAIGRIVQTLRTAQAATPSEHDLSSLVVRAKEEGLGDLPVDPAMAAITAPETPPEDAELMGRAMSVYKACIEHGAADGNELYDAIESGFDRLPADTPFMRDLVDAAKTLTLIDARFAMEGR